MQKNNLISILLLLVLTTMNVIAGNGDKDKGKEKISRLGEYEGYSEAKYKGTTYQSNYITMSDGCQIAVDVYLPKKLEQNKTVPTIMYFVRYVRSLQLKQPFRFLSNPYLASVSKKEMDFFTSHGYAVAIVDLRGSGASFGYRKMEFSYEEVKDMGESVDWIVAQDWSDGSVGSTGVSYTGTTAELLLANQHPAVKACIARSNIYDLYTDMTFPGGVRQAPFVKVWRETTHALDNSSFKMFGTMAGLLIKGTQPVQGDKKGKLLEKAIKEHEQNFNVFDGIFRVRARDEKDVESQLSLDDFSIHHKNEDIVASGTPIYRISGWYDGALMNSVFKGYWNNPNTEKVLIGPWDHGPAEHISPFDYHKKAQFDVYTEMLRFFDFHLKGMENGIDKEPTIVYYQMGKERFETADSWPPENTKPMTFQLSTDGVLSQEEGARGIVDYICDYTTTTGPGTRWNSQTPLYRDGPIRYSERSAENAKMIHFTSTVFEEDRQLTGHPILDLHISADAEDAVVFAYLEDVAPNGDVQYITEGQFRALHRKVGESPKLKQIGPFHSFKQEDEQPLTEGEVAQLQFDLLPTSYLLQKGHALRLSIAPADKDHFDIPKERPSKLQIHCTATNSSKIVIPFEE